ncbi:MAG: hypothetical protein JNL01_15325 [Bdellovibrionales bacterium]|nr:hypothetical protein [Bdellovibrionales bacterium]
MNKIFSRVLSSVLALSLVLSPVAWAGGGSPWAPGSENWEYNMGPDPQTKEGRELIEIAASLPSYGTMSYELMDSQKFRFIFGLMMTRTYYEKDAVKMLFIGQDATHIAEAAKQPGTSGFGARVQSIGNFFGVDQGVSTTNAYLSTIKGQYGSFTHPYVEGGTIKTTSFVDNQLWMLSNSEQSEIRVRREQFWEWMIKNNPSSLQMMVVFGGAARDAFAEFLIARGAKVGTRFTEERLKGVRVPETQLMYAGGNNEFPVPVDKKGRDIYSVLLKRKMDYSKPADQTAANELLTKRPKEVLNLMVFSGKGINGSGIVNPAQLGGYDLSKVEINGKKTVSLKGLKLSDGTVIRDDIAFAVSAHPSSLSKMKPADASKALRKSFEPLEQLKRTGWKVVPDLDDQGKLRRNLWDEGKDYVYGRADIRPGYFEFGAPDDRRVSRADASRMGADVIVAGTRDKVSFSKEQVEAIKASKPSEATGAAGNWLSTFFENRDPMIFDRGPGADIAKAIMNSLDRSKIFAPKPGMTFEANGIDALNVKTHEGTGFFGIHRGSFETAKVLILADPHGLDDWTTSRALTGTRGQYLNGLMKDLGYGDDYLVLKTVPVGMDGATAAEWEVTRKNTEKYREAAIKEALKNTGIETIFTDGPIAKVEMERILAKLGVTDKKVISIARTGMNPESGIVEAGKAAGKRVTAKMVDIPRAHLTFWSNVFRPWEGRGGDQVVDAKGKAKGAVRGLVAPAWVTKQKFVPTPEVKKSIAAIKRAMKTAGARQGGQEIAAFLSSIGADGSFASVAPDFEVVTAATATSRAKRQPASCDRHFEEGADENVEAPPGEDDGG